MEWILILAFIGVIGFLIYKHSQKENEDVSTTYSPTPTTDPLSKPGDNHSPAKSPELADCVRIYEYTGCTAVKRCCCCDGENERSANICCICGSQIEI